MQVSDMVATKLTDVVSIFLALEEISPASTEVHNILIRVLLNNI